MITHALSIRQPWVEMILRGQKRIEVREWQDEPIFRGPFLIHAAEALDWRSIALFAFDNALELPREGVIGAARVVEVQELDPARWHTSLMEHWVVRQRRHPQYGLILADIVRFPKVLRCGGGRKFYPVPTGVAKRASDYLDSIGWNMLP